MTKKIYLETLKSVLAHSILHYSSAIKRNSPNCKLQARTTKHLVNQGKFTSLIYAFVINRIKIFKPEIFE